MYLPIVSNSFLNSWYMFISLSVNKYSIKAYGVGLGSLELPCPNLVRILKIDTNNEISIVRKSLAIFGSRRNV